MRFDTLVDVDLEPLWEDEINHKISIKNSLLFSTIEGIKKAIIQKDTLAEALNYYSKLSLDYPIVILDSDSFDRLKNKFLEIQTGTDFEDMSTASDELIEV